MKHIKNQLNKTAKEIQTQTPKKAPLRAAKYEREEVEREDGQLVAPNKPKKKVSVVAIKHKAVLDNLTRKNKGKTGKKSMTQAMIDAGYSKNYADSGDIKKTKSWDRLMDEYLPDSLIAETHHGLMVAKKLDYMLFVAEIKDEDI